MKEITREVTTKEIVGYESIDGNRFDTKEECIKYEKTARIVCCKEVSQYKIGEGTHYDLFEEGSTDSGVEVYSVKDEDAVHKLNMYIASEWEDVKYAPMFSNEMIGQDVCLLWNWDHNWCYYGTINDLLNQMNEGYQKMLKRTEDEKGE